VVNGLSLLDAGDAYKPLTSNRLGLLVELGVESWNQVAGWLRQLRLLRSAA
jgi:hypothetical protein